METLVVVMIMATAMAVIMQLFAGGLRANSLADHYSRAIFHARAKMEEMLIAEKMAPGILEGAFDAGYRFRVEISLDDPDAARRLQLGNPLPVLFQIRVDVSWKDGESTKTFTLTTLKLAELLKGTGKTS